MVTDNHQNNAENRTDPNVLGQLSRATLTELEKQASQQIAKWVISLFVLLLIIAATGWWFYFEPKIQRYIIQAGGVPRGAIAMSEMACGELDGGWESFTAGTGRFVVGAGNETNEAYGTWQQQQKDGTFRERDLHTYKVMKKGGEEEHVLIEDELPSHTHSTAFADRLMRLDGKGQVAFPEDGKTIGTGSATNLSESAQIPSVGKGLAHNNIPPFIALYYCRKK